MKLHSGIFLAAILILSGCTTVEFVRKDLTPVKQAIIRYPPQSNPKSEAKYRDELAREAREFCGGEYAITKEYQAREETGTATGMGTGIGMGMGRRGFGSTIMLGSSTRPTAMYHFVELACK